MPQNKLKGGSEAHACPSAPRSRPSVPGSQDAAVLRSADSESPGLSDASISGASPSPEEEGKERKQLIRVIYTTCWQLWRKALGPRG